MSSSLAAPAFLDVDIQRKYKCMLEEVGKRIMNQNLWENKAKIFLDNSYYSYCLRLYQYDKYDNEIRQLDETEVLSLPDYKDYYYRLEPFKDMPRGRIQAEHFGVSVSNEGSNAFDMGIYENQLINDLIKICDSPDELIETLSGNLGWHRRKFYELSMLNHDEFNAELKNFMKSIPVFTEIDNLYSVSKTAGLYLMVLDDYACCYIGQAKDIMLRIRQHWRKTNFGTDGIDMFKAFDTTRIFVACTGENIKQNTIDKLEYAFIHAIDRRYLLNCLGGGGSLESIHSDSSILGYGTDPV